jgi:hypothetical protein
MSSLNLLKLGFEIFCQLRESRYGVIPDVREWYIRMKIFVNVLDILLAVIIDLLVEDNCGIGKVWGEHLSVSTMRSLAVAEMYTF